MDDIAVIKAAEHMDDSIRFADVGEELVTKSFAIAGTLDESGYIDYLHGGRYNAALGVTEFAEAVQTLVGNRDDSEIRLDGAEGKIG